VKATEVTAGLAESNGSLLPGLWRDLLHVTCWLTACTPGSAPGPTLGNEYGKTLPLPLQLLIDAARIVYDTVCGGVYVTVRRLSVSPSACLICLLLQQCAAGLLLWAPQAGDIDPLLQQAMAHSRSAGGGQQQM